MATKIYKIENITLIDGTVIEIIPLKIKYLRKFMEAYQKIKQAKDDHEAIDYLLACAVISMEQYAPHLLKDKNYFEDNLDIPTIYKILDVAADINVDGQSEVPVKEQAEESGKSWDDLNLVELESELFLLGNWKDYNQLESHLSMPELLATIEVKRKIDLEDKKFMAAIQGVDLDKEMGSEKGQKEWEDMKARVFSKGQTTDSNDVLSLQGINAQKAGFGIGMGLDYEDLRNT